MDNQYNVLVIDDDLIIRKLIFSMLKNNFNVITIDNAFDGLNIIKTQNFDAVICDILMPEMNGIDLTKEIRKITDMPILIITGDTDEKYVGMAFEFGVDDFMNKPLSPTILNHKLNFLINKHKQKIELNRLFKEVKYSEERHAAFISAIPDTVICFDKNDICFYHKPSNDYNLMFNHSIKLGCHMEEIWINSRLGEPYKHIYDKIKNILYQAKEDKQNRQFTYEVFSQDKQEKFVREIRLFFFGEDYAFFIKDITHEKRNEESLITSKNILTVAANIASSMLSSEHSSFNDLINQSLEDIGKSISANRVFIFENRYGMNNEVLLDLSFEWTELKSNACLNVDFNLNNINYNELNGWYNKFSKGEFIQGNICEYSENIVKYFKPKNSDYILLIPIFVDKQFWGIIGIESQDNNKIWNDTEINSLMLCASILGGGISMNKAQNKIIEKEQLYKGIVNDQAEFIVKWTMPEGRVVFANKSFLNYENINEEQINKVFLKDLFDNQNWIELMMKVMPITAQNPVVYYELFVQRENGETNIQQWTTRGIFNNKNKLIEYQSVGRDITENMKMEQELENAKNKIMKFENANSLIKILDDSSQEIEEILKSLKQKNDSFGGEKNGR